MPIAIRSVRLPDDYAPLAQLLTAERWPTTPEALAHEDAVRNPAFFHAVFVAEDTEQEPPRLVGLASIGHDTLAHRLNKFTMDMRVSTENQGYGIGKRLYQEVEDAVRRFAPCEIETMVWAAHERALRFVMERGFVETWRRIDFSLDSSTFDDRLYAELEEDLSAQGIQVKTYSALADEPDRLARFYALDRELWQDVPYGEIVTRRSFEQFVKEEIETPNFLPDACFIATQGELFLGYSHLIRAGQNFDTPMTGVLASYRGKGIATLLKLSTIRYAQAHGGQEIWTVNDSVNTAMMALNTKLGFQRRGALLRFVKRIGKTQA